MLKMSRLAPLAKALEAKYGDDKQKYQQELMTLYKQEGVSTTAAASGRSSLCSFCSRSTTSSASR